jgi:exonuclease III
MNYSRKICSINVSGLECAVKKSLLKEFLINKDCDIVFLQEVVFTDFNIIFGFEAIINIGTAPRGTAVLMRSGIQYRDLLLSTCGRIISFAVEDTVFINVYPISGSQHKKERRDFFLNDIVPHLSKPNTNKYIIGGDFNCILDPADTRGTSKNLCHELKRMVETLSMKDIYTKFSQNYNSRQFTFHRGNSASRLDRFYASNSLFERITDLEVSPVCFSDHHAILIKLRIESGGLAPNFGRGYWKINPMYLNISETNDRFKNAYEVLKTRLSHQNNITKWWSIDLKSKTKHFYKTEAIEFNRDVSRQKDFFYGLLQELTTRQSNGQTIDVDIGFVKRKLFEIEKAKLDALKLKMNSNSLCEEERVNLFHFMKQKQSGKTMNEIKINGVLVRDVNIIKQHVEDSYKTLLSGNVENDQHDASSLDFISTRVDEDFANYLTREITAEEIKKTLHSCSNKKSPGPDGLTYEFYAKHFETVKDDLVLLFNKFMHEPNTIPKNFSMGTIVLIPKKGNANEINEFRPISLLNCDYKLFAKILANRITTNIDQLLESGQTACINNSSCVQNVSKLRNLIAKAANCRRMKFGVFSLDLNKAFDRVRHTYLWRILEKFGFPESFINILKKLYQHATSRVMVNGHMTNEIPIKRSVRQGCPLSMVLFILYIEPLLKMLDSEIVGMQLGRERIKSMAYADDVWFVVQNEQEASGAFRVIQNFCEESGSSLNINKSVFMRLNNCNLGVQHIPEVESLKILGIKFRRNLNDTVKENYDSLIQTVKFIIRNNSIRNLNLIQKVWTINTFILSKLWYVSQVIPPGNQQIAQLKTAVGNFLWAGHLYRVDRRQLYLNRLKGGLSLVSIEHKMKALFLKNLMLKKVDGVNIPQPDALFEMRHQPTGLTRNIKEWSALNETLDTTTLTTTKQLYDEMIRRENFSPRIEGVVNGVAWAKIWRNLSLKHLPTQWTSAVYLYVNDAVPCGTRLNRHQISGDPPICTSCGLSDDANHRVKYCLVSKTVWQFLKTLLIQRLGLQIHDPADLLSNDLSINGKAGLWLTTAAIWYNMTHFRTGHLDNFKQEVREMRWKKKEILARFMNALNLF